MALLGFDAQCGDRTRVETLDADRLSGLLAIAICALVDTPEGIVDLGNEFSLPVARPELESAVGLRGRPVGDVRMLLGIVL